MLHIQWWTHLRDDGFVANRIKVRHSRLAKNHKTPADPWSEKNKEKVYKLRVSGLPWQEVLKEFPGCNIRALKWQFKHFRDITGSPRAVHESPWSQEEEESMVALAMLDKTWKEIQAGPDWEVTCKMFEGRTVIAMKERHRRRKHVLLNMQTICF